MKVIKCFKQVLSEGYLENLRDPVYWQHQVDYQLEHFGRVGGGLYQDLDEAGFYLDKDYKVTKKVKDTDESLLEDTIKNSKGKWVNKGKEGTHGEFKTKKEADAQRKAMYARGFGESFEDDLKVDRVDELTEKINELGIELDKLLDDENYDRSEFDRLACIQADMIRELESLKR